TACLRIPYLTLRTVSSTLFIFLLLCPRLLHAQEVQLSERRKQILAEALEKADPLIGANAPQPFGSVVDLTAFSNLLPAWLANAMTEDSGRKAVYQKLFDLMEAKTDKQVGAASDTKGTTTLVMKAAAPKILGFAVEHGGLYETVDGTIATFRGSPVGLIKTLQKECFLDMFQDL